MGLKPKRGHSYPLMPQPHPRRADRNVRASIQFRISPNLNAKWNYQNQVGMPAGASTDSKSQGRSEMSPYRSLKRIGIPAIVE